VNDALREVVNSLAWDVGQEYPRATWRALRVAVDPAGASTVHLSTGGAPMIWAPSRHSMGLIDFLHGGLADNGYRSGLVLDVAPHQAVATWF